jgi:transcriptional regulator with XRE-family HTH domain
MVDSGPDFGSRFDRLYSAGTGQAASIRATAKALGVSRDTVRRMREGNPSPRGEAALRRAERREARRPQWLDSGPDVGRVSQMIPVIGTGPSERDVRGQLEMVAIRRTDGSIDRAATGQAFGVSTSTIGRWLRGESRPTMAHQGELRTEVRSRLLTDSADAMDQAFAGANVFLRFNAKVSSDQRYRAISRHLDGQAMRGAHTAWLAGGEAGLTDFLRSDIEDNYFGGGGVPDAEVLDITEATLSTRLY